MIGTTAGLLSRKDHTTIGLHTVSSVTSIWELLGGWVGVLLLIELTEIVT